MHQMTFQTLTYRGALTCADSVEMGDHNLDRSQPGSEDLRKTRGNFTLSMIMIMITADLI